LKTPDHVFSSAFFKTKNLFDGNMTLRLKIKQNFDKNEVKKLKGLHHFKNAGSRSAKTDSRHEILFGTVPCSFGLTLKGI